ncbi:MAG: enoyl-CoA hydratase/isomerase family protein [Elusimicrobia bacterium]|nr:enoyl-CoA hydratase/isomerase family protein [Elusimicrobiota bacterium]
MSVAKDGAVATVTFRGREPGNILSRSLMESLAAGLGLLENDPAVRCVVLAGAPTAFCAGWETSELEATPVLDPGRDSYLACWDRIGRLSKPLLAAVSGPAFGPGFELALACDLVTAGESALFGFDQLDLGVSPGAGGGQRLARALGRHRALDLILTGRRLNGLEAMEAGLVCHVWPDELLLRRTLDAARTIATKAPLAVKAAKESVLEAEEVDLENGLHFERRLFGDLFSTMDQKEGMKALRDGRKPSFEGK